MRIHALGARVLLAAIVLAAVAVPLQPPQRAAAADQASSVIASARHHLGAPWSYGAMGPYAFDCSGLVLHAFKEAGLYSVVGSGSYRSASALYWYFRSRGLATASGGRPGDLVVYGGGSHVGIYLGDGQVISTLTRGVSIHGLYAVTSGFTAFLRTNLSTTTSSTLAMIGVRYTTREIYLRRGPGMEYAIIQSLIEGRYLAVYGSRKDTLGRVWYYVRITNGRFGYVPSWLTRT